MVSTPHLFNVANQQQRPVPQGKEEVTVRATFNGTLSHLFTLLVYSVSERQAFWKKE
jgi:hypothetical protein